MLKNELKIRGCKLSKGIDYAKSFTNKRAG
jgi:hypothetical protein